MSGYPHQPPGYGYGAPPPPQPYGSTPYGAPPPQQQQQQQGYATPYAAPQSHTAHTAHSPYAPVATPYGSAPPSAPPYDPHKPPKENKPPKDQYSSSSGSGYPSSAAPGGYGSNAFASLLPSSGFPPGTDPNVIACFQIADQDGSGLIDDKELQRALSSYNQSFSLRTVHLLMHHFTNSNSRKIGPKEFTALFYSLQSWRDIFDRFDRDRSGKIDLSELREALMSLGFAVSPVVLDLLVSKFDKTGGKSKAIEYDNFIECCLTVKGLTEKFKEKDRTYSGSATFNYEEFMLTVLPFLIA